ncbi:MAG: RluA family pseudouridine synthase [Candidatus Delongbacteria bacterium]|jgi:23S rRNA pseudouridine1911/1915/1917 synthase|nr:RluA family pseudouridine synthase [Candidatus Delongbacteria bacterium]
MTEHHDTNDHISEASDLFEHYQFKASPGLKIIRLDKFLVDKMENTSRSKIQSAADAGNIFVNDEPQKSNYKVKPGDVISIRLDYPRREIELIPEDIPLDVVYEDDSLIVINKPVGMVVHPGYGNYTGTLMNALMYRFKDLPMFQSGEARPGLVHRIDKNTSGLLVVAKTDQALQYLSKQFYDKTSSRIYHALVWGLPSPAEGTITGHIGRSLKNRKVMHVFPEGDYGKPAVTHYRVIEDLGYVSLLECRLETGRTHQIRVHFKHIKHPLFNDFEYGGDKVLRGTVFTKYKQFVKNCFDLLPGQVLHARTLGFDHPETGERMFFEAEPGKAMQQLINKWRNYTANRSCE